MIQYFMVAYILPFKKQINNERFKIFFRYMFCMKKIYFIWGEQNEKNSLYHGFCIVCINCKSRNNYRH